MTFDTQFVNKDTIQEVKKLLKVKTSRLGIGGGGKEFDLRRFAITIEYMKKFDLHRGACVEIGSLDYLSSKIIWSFFPGATVAGTENDLRYELLPFPDGSVDNVICTEVVEHISDIQYAQGTTLSGLFYFLDEVYRILKVGGKALITTPNAASLFAIHQILLQHHPMMYSWHFREFTKNEMQQIVEYSGFNIVAHNTEFVWHLYDFSYITALIHDFQDRGDDQFIVISKPETRVRKQHNLLLPGKSRAEV